MRHLPKRPLTYGLAPGLVCRSCRRQFASLPSAPHPTPATAGLASLSSRRLISIAGPDAAKFLQGIVTANVISKDGQPRADGFYAAFLTATGRVLYDVFVYPNHGASGASGDEPGFLIEVDADQAQTLAKHIKRYKLRAKLAVKLLAEDEASVWHAWDDSGNTSWDSIMESTRLSFKDPRTPGLGYRFARLDQKAPEIDLEQSTEDAYTIRRYLQGVPEGQDEMPKEHSLPQESNMDIMNGIDWRKGCYVGQELTIRTRHRGVVRKRILPCMVYEKDHAPPTTLSYHADSATLESATADMIPQGTSIGRFEKRGRSAGKWLKGVGNIGLGLCRLEIMTDVALPGETAAAAFKPEDEFVLEWGEEGSKTGVKIKAFVPEWLRQGLEAQKMH
ncbi:putative transferase CAF17, mitochondrial [Neonectria ditissima]|uniref:Iron-sulfur cluster assembly factor IBA57 homolog, mitochondrial n=1 Tax=Neonectria ditissima TaxID=78410 RepID=A0A0P7BJU8_9HYPO|nr:putative transferase CAF17, mitochondrial [Neonectria ditissima]